MRLLAVWISCFIAFAVSAQETVTNNDNADFMRSNGKIYVVVAIVLTVLVGLIVYVISIDRKISKLERES
jgi:uncharacterized membrane protein